jgi:hypothetical protein
MAHPRMRSGTCYSRAVARDEDLQAIAELGRKTRTPTPRWLWITAAVIGAVCAVGFAAMMLGARDPAHRPARQLPSQVVDSRSVAGGGLGIGLVIGLGVGIVIGFSIARQRRSHSSRNSP